MDLAVELHSFIGIAIKFLLLPSLKALKNTNFNDPQPIGHRVINSIFITIIYKLLIRFKQVVRVLSGWFYRNDLRTRINDLRF
jgi:hypothetical protein